MRRTDLIARAIQQTMFATSSISDAIARLHFVQADPIKAPATAQDLVLRHRVNGYRVRDLERTYPELEIEEDYFYAYGFVSRTLRSWLHPRADVRLTKLQERVLDAVREAKEAHPRDLEAAFGKRRVVNAWGGYSKATTHALDKLHHRGHLRIVRRENGIRVYALASPHEPETSEMRLAHLVRTMAGILAPVPLRTLHANTARFRHLGNPRQTVARLIEEGELERHRLDEIDYVMPPGEAIEPPRVVRLLAPFDPIVWDRARFEHLFGWQYRFEAYTPKKKRVRGYYAMPLLWGDSVIGWANVDDDVDLGFVGKRPKERAFSIALEQEIEALRAFLHERP